MNNTPPPAPVKGYPFILIDSAWQRQVMHPSEIPLPPAPRKGYRETLVDGKWYFVKK